MKALKGNTWREDKGPEWGAVDARFEVDAIAGPGLAELIHQLAPELVYLPVHDDRMADIFMFHRHIIARLFYEF